MEFTALEISLIIAVAVLAAALVFVRLSLRKFALKAARRLDVHWSALLREAESENRRLQTLNDGLKKSLSFKGNPDVKATSGIAQTLDIEKLTSEQKKLEIEQEELTERNRQLWEMSVSIEKERQNIQEQKIKLEKALQDLKAAQNELIRQSKMVTVGKLTQGLIDRILNPLNYINNFTKLSAGLVGDVSANIEDDKDKMDSENYEDTVDVLGMLKGNLQKVAEHGLAATRTLKSMEEVIKDRTGGMISADLKPVLVQDEEMTKKFYEDRIKKYGIKVSFDVPETEMPIDGNPDLLSKTFMSIINNSFYALAKKAERIKYEPELRITAETGDGCYVIKFYDNGIGIEETILDKVFDPFFTTKPTGEASGVGLYLSREIIQNHHGDISVKSVKDEFSEFTVVLNI